MSNYNCKLKKLIRIDQSNIVREQWFEAWKPSVAKQRKADCHSNWKNKYKFYQIDGNWNLKYENPFTRKRCSSQTTKSVNCWFIEWALGNWLKISSLNSYGRIKLKVWFWWRHY